MVPRVTPEELSRISKFFVDRDQEHPDRALVRRRRHRIVLACGPDVAASYTLQLAVFTAANLASRCFPRAVRVEIDDRTAAAPALVFASTGRSIGRVLASIIGHHAVREKWSVDEAQRRMLFGDLAGPDDALRVTFDGWVAAVGPSALAPRLPERQFCTLTGVLAGAMAVSEAFLSFAQVAVDASRRAIALSLWRPDLDAKDSKALGIPVEVLPAQMWILGLGHLGQAYLWALATLPYSQLQSTNIILNDFDAIEPANVETGVLLKRANVGRRKTRVCSRWLESLGFNTTIVERKFRPDFRCQPEEPQLALCGFDSNEARRALAAANFRMVIDGGLGALASNFETLNVQTFPSTRPVEELWRVDRNDGRNAERIANESGIYGELSSDDECGRVLLAGKAVAVPFVGAVAATYVVAEVLRALHGGPGYSRLKLRLATPHESLLSNPGAQTASAVGSIAHCNARRL